MIDAAGDQDDITGTYENFWFFMSFGGSRDVQELSSAMENVGKCLLRLERWVEAERVLRCLNKAVSGNSDTSEVVVATRSWQRSGERRFAERQQSIFSETAG